MRQPPLDGKPRPACPGASLEPYSPEVSSLPTTGLKGQKRASQTAKLREHLRAWPMHHKTSSVAF
jgi:hypothetical protein